jgi:hypothetical protein
MLNDLTTPMGMGITTLEIDGVAEALITDNERAFAAGHDGRLHARYALEAVIDLLRDPVQIIDYVPNLARRPVRDAVEGTGNVADVPEIM